MRLTSLAVATVAVALPTALAAGTPAAAQEDDSTNLEITTSVDAAPVRHRTQYVETDSLLEGDQTVLVEGVDGRRRRAVATTARDGEIVRRLVVWSRVVRRPVTEVVVVGTGAPTPPVDPVWDRLAECESGGDWSINTGNGYYGGLQFAASTWSGLGGSGLPHENSREEQIRLATVLRDQSGGYGPWPSCAARLGLPT